MATSRKLSKRETRKLLKSIKKNTPLTSTTTSEIIKPDTRSVTIYKSPTGSDVAIKKTTTSGTTGKTRTTIVSSGGKKLPASVLVTPNNTMIADGKPRQQISPRQLIQARQILARRLYTQATPLLKRETERKKKYIEDLIERQRNLRERLKEQAEEKKQKFREKALKEGSFYRQTEANISYVKGTKAFKKGVDIADVVSGGKITEKKIMKQQEALNKEIERYNKDYEGKKELEPTAYAISKERFNTLEKRQKEIDKQKEAWATSGKSWVRTFVYGGGNEPWVSKEEQNRNLKEVKKSIKETRAKIEKLEKKLESKDAKGKKGKLLKSRLKLQEKLLKSKFEERDRYQQGQGKKIIATVVPISIATLGTPTGIKGIKQGLKDLYGIGKGGTVTKVKGKANTYKVKGGNKGTSALKVSKAQQKKILSRRKALEKYYKNLAKKKARSQPFRQKVIKIKEKLTPKRLKTLVKKFKRGTTRKVIYTDDKITIYSGRRIVKPKIKVPKIKPKVPRKLRTLINKLKRTRTYKVKAVGKGKKVFVYNGKKLVKPKFKLPKIKKPKIRIPKKLKPKYTRKVVYQDKGVTIYKGKKLVKPKITKAKPKIKKGGGMVGYEKTKVLKKPKARKGIYEYRKVGNRYVRKLRFVKDKAKPVKDIIVDIRTPKPKYRTVRTSGGRTSRQLVRQKPKVTIKVPREYYNKVTRNRIQKVIKNLKPAQKQKLAKAIQRDLKKINTYNKKQAIAQYQRQLNKQFPRARIGQAGLLVGKVDSLNGLRRILTGSSIIDALYNSRFITPEKFKELQKSNLKDKQKSGQGEATTEVISPISRTAQAQAIAQPQIPRQVLTSVGIPRATIKKGIIGLNRKQLQKLQKKGYKMGYNVYGKSGNKYIKINKKPLSKLDAVSKGTYVIDRTTSRTLKVEPIGLYKSLGYLSKKEKSYASRNKQKFREYKIRSGRILKLKQKYIEKRKYLIDSRGEKKGLTLAKYLAKQKPKVKRMKGGRIWYGWKSNRRIKK